MPTLMRYRRNQEDVVVDFVDEVVRKPGKHQPTAPDRVCCVDSGCGDDHLDRIVQNRKEVRAEPPGLLLVVISRGEGLFTGRVQVPDLHQEP
jgi:hypothetical protein